MTTPIGRSRRHAPRDEDDIRLWIVSPREMDPRVRKPSYDLPEFELQALIAYVKSLTTPEG